MGCGSVQGAMPRRLPEVPTRKPKYAGKYANTLLMPQLARWKGGGRSMQSGAPGCSSIAFRALLGRWGGRVGGIGHRSSSC